MQDQSTANYVWFQNRLPSLLATHRGKHALLHSKNIEAFYQTSLEAVKAGILRFGEGNFSVEYIDDSLEDLGFYSHVSAALHA